MNATLQSRISEARFKTYLDATGGDSDVAEDLYILNLRLSAAAYKSIQVFEIFLRNSMDSQLKQWNLSQQGSSDWALSPAPMLRMCFKNDGEKLSNALDDASKSISKSKNLRPITHDDVVAQIPFSGWRYLLPPNQTHHAKERIWNEALIYAFPNRHEKTSKATLVKWVSMIYDLRNRVAHHEPIFYLDMQARRRAMADVCDCIGRDAKKWFVQQDEFSQLITEFQQFNKQKLKQIT